MSTNDAVFRQAMEGLRELIDEASRRGEEDPTSAVLATVDGNGQPSVRMIDVVQIGEHGAVFFTDGGSGKAAHLRANPRAALCWHWPRLKYQASLEGVAERLDDEAADACWHSRPREKRLGSWASVQAQPLQDQAQLERGLRQARAQFSSDTVPRPPSWVAFCIVPRRIELWRIGWQRLRAKQLFAQQADGRWIETAVNP